MKQEDDVGRILGWKVESLKEKNFFVIEKRNLANRIIGSGESKKYFVSLPELTCEEAFLIQKIVLEFRDKSFGKDKKSLELFIERYCIENNIFLDNEQKDYFQRILFSEILGFSCLDCFLGDDEIEEISIIGTGREKPVFVFDRKFGWLKTNVFFGRNSLIKNLVNKMARKLGRRLTLECPKLNANLPDGSRLTASMPPISKEINVTIRKFRKQPFTPIDLIENNTISSEACAFLWLALELESSIIIAGNTGSGKTSSLNAFFSFIPMHERIIIVEETPEINIMHEHCIRMNVVKEQNIGMPSLIIDTLRMRPDRVIVGEIRNSEETLAFMDTLLAGQGRGSYATFHAQSAKEAVARLNFFGINEPDLNAIDLLVVQRRWNPKAKNCAEKRRIIEICEIILSEKGIETNKIFEFDYKQDSLKKTGESIRIMDKARDFLGMNCERFWEELSVRKKFLEKMKGKKVSFNEFIERKKEFTASDKK